MVTEPSVFLSLKPNPLIGQHKKTTQASLLPLNQETRLARTIAVANDVFLTFVFIRVHSWPSSGGCA